MKEHSRVERRMVIAVSTVLLGGTTRSMVNGGRWMVKAYNVVHHLFSPCPAPAGGGANKLAAPGATIYSFIHFHSLAIIIILKTSITE